MSERQKVNMIRTHKDAQTVELLNALDEIVLYIDDFIDGRKIKNLRGRYSIAILKASSQQASAISLIVAKRPMAKVSTVLLRTIYESHIRVNYINLYDDDTLILKNTINSIKSYSDNMARLQEFYELHGLDIISTMPLNKVRANIRKAEKASEEYAELLKKVQKNTEAHKYKKELHEQVRDIDKVNGFDSPDSSAEYNFRILYNTLSAHVHMNFDGANRWIEQSGKYSVLNGSGESAEDNKRILWTTLALIKDIAVITMHALDAYDEVFDHKYQEIVEKNR